MLKVPLTDKFGRAITDLRISVTDRCNYKCVYCRTGNEGALYGDLPFADYLRMARVLVELGIQKVRITGGEPLLRKGVIDFVRQLAKLRTTDGDDLDIALTTNGHLLADMAQPLKDAGLRRVTVSMDAVDPDRFARITRVPDGYDNVLAGIRESRRVGLWPVKVNCVLMRGFNEDQVIPFGMFAREEGVVVRFIEFMPLEEDRVWSPNTVVTLDEILQPHGANTGHWWKFRMPAAKPPAATASTMASEKSASSRRYRIPSAATAAAFALPPTAKSALACFPFGTTTCTARCAVAHQTKNWRNSFAAWSRRKKSATTSANPISCPHPGPWSTSAAEQVLWRTGVVARRGIAPVLHYRAQVSPQVISP